MAEMKSGSTAEGPYLLGMDIGTGGVRVGIFDRKGTPVVFEGVEFETHHPRPGRAEQDPETWWSCLTTATRRALEEGGVSPREILGIGVDATASTLLAVDEQGGSLLPAIMWMDVRASEEAARIGETGDPALKYIGYGAVSAEWGLPKVLWLKENEREVYDGAGRVCDCLDWINHRLTGEWASSINVVSTKYFYDRDEGGWPESLYEAGGGGGAWSDDRHASGPGSPGRLLWGARARGCRTRQAGTHHGFLTRHDRAVRRPGPQPGIVGRLYRRHDSGPVHRRGRAGLHWLGSGLVQEPLCRRSRDRRGPKARCGPLRGPHGDGRKGTHRLGRARCARLFSGK